jgi:hypothetical protein
MEIGAEQIVQTAKGISDFGMMAIMAGAFLLLSVSLMGACFFWFKNIVDGIIKQNREDMKALISKQDTQNDLLHEIADGLRPTTLLQIKSISNTCFDLSIEKVCRIIRKVREENHIVDREATRSKIKTLLCNLHEDRNSRWDNIRYHGKTLTQYTSPEWIDWVAGVVEKEVYAENVNNGRAYTNVDAVYSKIRLDFYHKLTGV